MQEPQTFTLQGGLDLITQPLMMRPGSAIGAQNYESEARGYRRVDGHEIFDGHPKPSEASYWILYFENGNSSGPTSIGDTITGATSGATGRIVGEIIVESGAPGAGNAAGYMVLYQVGSTSFTDGENLQFSAVTFATANGSESSLGATTDALNDTYLQASIEQTRSEISAVPGEGSVLGIAALSGDMYAFRNATGGATMKMYKATATGWSEVGTSSLYIAFTSGSTEPSEGDAISGATSGATATIERVVLKTGSWGGGDAAGYLVLSGQTGTFQSENVDNTTTSAVNVMSFGGDSSTVTMAPSGKVRSKVYNFYGATNAKRLYFVTGEDTAFEFDGTVLAPVETGLTSALDKPTFIGVHNNHLILGFNGGYLQISGTGLPMSFSSTDGAADFNIGDDVTGIISSTKTSTIIAARNKISYLTGQDKNNFNLDDISDDSGAIADTMQIVGEPYLLDNIGVRSLSATDQFGDWAMGTVTQRVEPVFKKKKEQGLTVIGAFRVRGKNQYRLFWSDGTGVSIYFGRSEPECMLMSLGFNPTCFASVEDSSGYEVLLAGDDSGNVYQMDAGTSANGADIAAYLTLSYTHQGAPQQEKKYHRAFVDVTDGDSGNALYYTHNIAYGEPSAPTAPEGNDTVYTGGGFWDVSTWDQFYWDSATQAFMIADIYSVGTSISMTIFSDATYEKPHTIASVTINYSPRRKLR